MKALTVSQPFAELIASGQKWVENRRWYTPHRRVARLIPYRGRLRLFDVPDELLPEVISQSTGSSSLLPGEWP